MAIAEAGRKVSVGKKPLFTSGVSSPKFSAAVTLLTGTTIHSLKVCPDPVSPPERYFPPFAPEIPHAGKHRLGFAGIDRNVACKTGRRDRALQDNFSVSLRRLFVRDRDKGESLQRAPGNAAKYGVAVFCRCFSIDCGFPARSRSDGVFPNRRGSTFLAASGRFVRCVADRTRYARFHDSPPPTQTFFVFVGSIAIAADCIATFLARQKHGTIGGFRHHLISRTPTAGCADERA